MPTYHFTGKFESIYDFEIEGESAEDAHEQALFEIREEAVEAEGHRLIEARIQLLEEEDD